MKEIVIWAEHRDGKLLGVSLEILSAALKLSSILNGRVSALLLGCDCAFLCSELIAHGASRVFHVDDPRLAIYQAEAYATICSEILAEIRPEIVLMGGTSFGAELAPAVAAKLQTGLTAHCVDLSIENINGRDQLVMTVPGWGGNLMVKILCPDTRPQMATIRPGILDRGESDPMRKGKIVPVVPHLKDIDFRACTVETVLEPTVEVSLEDAEVIVSGGFGLYESGGFAWIEKLASAIGGEVAGSRPAFDAGWIPENRMIGQSGKIVRPKLFISVGASGAAHYTTGFLNAGIIVGIDKNPKAPIFEVADFGIVGDLAVVIPALVEELEKGRDV